MEQLGVLVGGREGGFGGDRGCSLAVYLGWEMVMGSEVKV
jgi:hypothetical protein